MTSDSSGADRRTLDGALPPDLMADLEHAGYFPQTAAASLTQSLRGARVLAHLVRPEATFDGDQLRRHLTVLVLTDRHLIMSHLDDELADELNPSQVVATTDRVRLSRVDMVGLSQVFDTDGQRVRGTEAEVTLGISWRGARRIDMERAYCDDPQCQADHGYTGTSTPADLALRISARADGDEAVRNALAFHARLSDALEEFEG
ncbi:hypothetical protein JSY14_00180 [Brachybacterium sp. EF45031]|uniref:DUF5998 family protein n=1 Tax=Brachybacterium sillae TaxID=2810536 RepID=UPI00217DD7DE|nr:DUF5998 family protein [Brachybacterium sillae]MCS6710509.1 hypothetical protein [Brachybacterium sillae]